jgi:hypothetical protein
MLKSIFSLSLLLFSVLFFSCKKDSDDAGPYKYTIRMTDDDGPYDAVYIDLRAVEITGSAGTVVSLNVHSRIYNLLNFSNGVDTLLATGYCRDSKVEQIRLILGPNNSIVVDGISYPLSTPSAEQSGLKLQVNHTLKAGIDYTVLLDFDANKSIVKEGNGSYKLKPVIRTVEAALTGIIKGKITPTGILAVVSASSTQDYSSYVTLAGDFKILGLLPGTYSVTVTPALPRTAVTRTNISVLAGQTTDVGTIGF